MEPSIARMRFPPPDRLCPGHVIGGKYRLEWPLAEGGMGVVWHATHLGLDAPVAIKVLADADGASAKVVESFLREAKAAAAVRHRNVVSTTDFGTDDEGQPFIVMELLEGRSLASIYDRGPQLTPAQLVDVLADCLAGLSAVHAAGILHRDLKPENVVLVSDGDAVYPKLIDFGISRALRDTPPRDGVTTSRRGAMKTNEGLMMGTPHYMSPEQARGLPDVDERADLYAIGVILYEGLAGRAPYDAPNVVDLLGAIVRGGAPDIGQVCPHVDPALAAVVTKAMAPRDLRYADAREMRAALLAAVRSPRATPSASNTMPLPLVVAAPVSTHVAEAVTLDDHMLPAARGRLTVAVAVGCALALVLGLTLWMAGTAPRADAVSPIVAAAPRAASTVRPFATVAVVAAPPAVPTVAPAVVPEAAPPAPPPAPTAAHGTTRRHRATSTPSQPHDGASLAGGLYRDLDF